MKRLIIANVLIWFLFVLIYQNFIAKAPYVFQIFGLVPWSVFGDFYLWQPLTYMFLHSSSVFHILFNMLMLWWLGSELERLWGRSFFLTYYFVCGLGAAFIYTVGLFLYYWITRNPFPLLAPVVGSSGAVFGLILAYGLLFGERIIYFMMLFPLKAKYFVMILGAVEVLTLLSSGVGGQVANLAHLGGLVSGFLFLWFFTLWKKRRRLRGGEVKRGRFLWRFYKWRRGFKVVSDFKHREDKKATRYWN